MNRIWCNICNETFETVDMLTFHKTNEHKKRCKWCNDIISIIKESFFHNIKENSKQKINMMLICKDINNKYTSKDYKKIKKIYKKFKIQKKLTTNEAIFINKKIEKITNEEKDIFEGDENSEEYDDFCFDIINNYGYNMLLIFATIMPYGILDNNENFIFRYEDEDTYSHISFEICEQLSIMEPDIKNIDELIDFLENLSFQQKNSIYI